MPGYRARLDPRNGWLKPRINSACRSKKHITKVGRRVRTAHLMQATYLNRISLIADFETRGYSQRVGSPAGNHASTLGLRLTIVVIAPLREHLFELLLLRVGHHCFEFALTVLHDGLCFFAAVLSAE